MTDAVLAEGLVKRYGSARALDGLDLVVPEGTVLGLLGPNGAGKTTTVRVLTTLLRPDAGRALVGGADAIRDPAAVRRRIGLAGQYTALDQTLTGRENLMMFGRLYRLGRRQARRRAEHLLERLDMAGFADRPVATYSGGMARRLDLASALVASPQVLFMDEPTTGLDPAARLALWDLLTETVRGGVSVLLTTQYLEEADRLADRIAVVDHGRVIASGTSDELKARIGPDRVEVHLAEPGRLPDAVEALRALGRGEPVVDAAGATVGVPAGSGASPAIPDVVRALDARNVAMLDIGLHRSSLDDVFLALTGARHAEPAPPPHTDEGPTGELAPVPRSSRRRRR